MREIKFRGKPVCSIEKLNDSEIPHKNGWVYGWYVDGWILGEYADSDDEWISFEWWAKVFPETVEQFTGLLDKYGVEIYEGDIVSAWSQGVKAIGEVKQRIDGLWLIYPAYQKEMFWGLMPNLKCETTVEVIGNIHDNPDTITRNKKESEIGK